MPWHLRLCHIWAQRLPAGGFLSFFIAFLCEHSQDVLCITCAFSFCGACSFHFGELFLPVQLACSMAAHVRNDRDVLSALEWLGQTDPGQISSVSRALPAQMRSSLIASIGASFVATDEPGPSTSAPAQPWLASGALRSSTPEADTRSNVEEPKLNDPWNPSQTGDPLHSEQTQMLRGHPVRKVDSLQGTLPALHFGNVWIPNRESIRLAFCWPREAYM